MKNDVHSWWRFALVMAAMLLCCGTNNLALAATNTEKEITLPQTTISLTHSGASTPYSTETVSYPKKLGKSLTVGVDDSLRVTFAPKVDNAFVGDIRQTFVRFSNSIGQEIIFAAPLTKNAYELTLDLAVSIDLFNGAVGPFELEIIIGDTRYKPLRWTFASITIAESHQERVQRASLYKPLPLMQHTFRLPEKRASSTLSFPYVGVVLSPLMLLLILWLSLGVNISNFPTGSGFLYATGFHGSLGAMIFVIIYGWAYLNMFQTLGYLGLLSLPLAFFGKLNLSNLASKRS